MSKQNAEDRAFFERLCTMRAAYARLGPEDRPRLVVNPELLTQVRRELGRPA